jgi:PAS domain S-box-containing protein
MQIPFQALIEQINEYAIVVLDAEGTIRSWNAGARAITGYTEREALGRPLTTLLGESLVDEALEAGQAVKQCWLRRKDAEPLWTRNVVQVVSAADGAAALCWLCQDPFDARGGRVVSRR